MNTKTLILLCCTITAFSLVKANIEPFEENSNQYRPNFSEYLEPLHHELNEHCNFIEKLFAEYPRFVHHNSPDPIALEFAFYLHKIDIALSIFKSMRAMIAFSMKYNLPIRSEAYILNEQAIMKEVNAVFVNIPDGAGCDCAGFLQKQLHELELMIKKYDLWLKKLLTKQKDGDISTPPIESSTGESRDPFLKEDILELCSQIDREFSYIHPLKVGGEASMHLSNAYFDYKQMQKRIKYCLPKNVRIRVPSYCATEHSAFSFLDRILVCDLDTQLTIQNIYRRLVELDTLTTEFDKTLYLFIYVPKLSKDFDHERKILSIGKLLKASIEKTEYLFNSVPIIPFPCQDEENIQYIYQAQHIFLQMKNTIMQAIETQNTIDIDEIYGLLDLMETFFAHAIFTYKPTNEAVFAIRSSLTFILISVANYNDGVVAFYGKK